MSEVIKQYSKLTGIDESECRFLVGGKALRTDKPLDVSNSLTYLTTIQELVAITNAEAQKEVDNDDYDCTSCSCMPTLR